MAEYKHIHLLLLTIPKAEMFMVWFWNFGATKKIHSHGRHSDTNSRHFKRCRFSKSAKIVITFLWVCTWISFWSLDCCIFLVLSWNFELFLWQNLWVVKFLCSHFRIPHLFFDNRLFLHSQNRMKVFSLSTHDVMSHYNWLLLFLC